MSLQGKLLRGLGWYKYRSAHAGKDMEKFGDLFLPTDILEDPHKMEEMEFYLDFVKNRDADAVHKILFQVRLFDLMNKPQRMVLEAKKLEELPMNKEEIDYSRMNKEEIQKALASAEIEYSETATKAELLELTGGI